MSSGAGDSMGRRVARGSMYRLAASSLTLALGLLRAVLLARLLLPEDFGVAALALFFVQLSAQLRGIGIGSALVHRPAVDERVLSTYFTLHLSLLLGSLVVLAAATPHLARAYPEMPLLGTVLVAFLGVELLKGLNQVPESLLAKDLSFRQLAVVDAVSSVVMTVVAPTLAWHGAGVFSLVAEQASGMLARFVLLWGVFLPFRPRPGWDPEIARWFLSYGSSIWKASKLRFAAERFDDFWIGTTLGDAALGVYSRAYEFAQYPRRVVASPLLSVFFPVFSRLQEDRLRLSRVFFRVTALMVRAGFGLSLLLIATAPEIVRLVLGERWVAMTLPFQLMVVYTLLDPLKLAVESLLSAVGRPDVHVRVGAVQVAFFVPAVVLLTRAYGIVGAALAADGMVALGALLLFRQSRRFVDYSSRALWLWPAVSAGIAGTVAIALRPAIPTASTWATLVVEGGLVLGIYGGLLLLVERAELRRSLGLVRDLLREDEQAAGEGVRGS